MVGDGEDSRREDLVESIREVEVVSGVRRKERWDRGRTDSSEGRLSKRGASHGWGRRLRPRILDWMRSRSRWVRVVHKVVLRSWCRVDGLLLSLGEL